MPDYSGAVNPLHRVQNRSFAENVHGIFYGCRRCRGTQRGFFVFPWKRMDARRCNSDMGENN